MTNREKIEQLFAHLHKAKDELERINVGVAHDEIIAALSITFTFEEDE